MASTTQLLKAVTGEQVPGGDVGRLGARQRAGDREAFGALVARHRGELQVHCYRMFGSLQDAEDALQDQWTARNSSSVAST